MIRLLSTVPSLITGAAQSFRRNRPGSSLYRFHMNTKTNGSKSISVCGKHIPDDCVVTVEGRMTVEQARELQRALRGDSDSTQNIDVQLCSRPVNAVIDFRPITFDDVEFELPVFSKHFSRVTREKWEPIALEDITLETVRRFLDLLAASAELGEGSQSDGLYYYYSGMFHGDPRDLLRRHQLEPNDIMQPAVSTGR